MSRLRYTVIAVLWVFIGFEAQGAGDPSDYWGTPVEYIRYECPASISEDIVLQAITIKKGDSLTPVAIRDTLKKLNLLNRFQSVQVYAENFGDGCALIFVLEPNWLIDDIRFEGGAISILFSYGLTGGFSPKMLLRETGLKRHDVFTTRTGQEAVQALTDFYYRSGYAKSRIRLQTRYDNTDHTVDLVFNVEQGPPTTIRSIYFDGNTSFSQRELLLVTDLFIGKHFSRERVGRARDKLIGFYHKHGYLSAQIFRPDVRYSPESNTVDVTCRLQEDVPVNIKLETDWHMWNLEWWLHLFENRQHAFLEDLGIGGSGKITERRMEEGRRNLEKQFWNHGYLNATVTLETERAESGNITYTYTVEENDAVDVGGIYFFGNDAFRSEELLAAEIIGTDVGDTYHHDTFEADRNDLEAFYLSHGYQEVKIVSGFTVDDQTDEVSVVFNIQEGPMYRWKRIQVQGNTALSTEKVLQILSVSEDGPYDPDTLENNIPDLLNAYLEKGYAEISIDREIRDKETLTPSLDIRIHEGVQAVIDSVLITGYSKTLRSVIERHLPELRDKPFYYQTLISAERSLARTNLFRSVDVNGVPTESGLHERTVTVRLREQPSIFLEGGPGYNTDRGFNGYLSFYTTNLGGANRYLGASGSISQEDYKTNVIYREPEFANLPVQLELRLLTEDSDEDGFRLRRRGGRATWSYRIRETLRLLLIYRFDDDAPYDINPDTDLPEEYQNSIQIGSLSPGFLYDSRDDPRDPNSGSLFSVKVEFARKVYNSEVNFSKATAEATHFFSLSDAGVLGAAFRFGIGDKLPYQERFRLGGIKTIRGWDYEDIRGGSDNADTGLIGPSGSIGDLMVLANLEYRYPLFWGLEGVVFIDSGNVYDDTSEISLSNLKSTVGLGVRFMTPVGPVGVDYGYNFMKDDGDPRDRWSFIIGHTF